MRLLLSRPSVRHWLALAIFSGSGLIFVFSDVKQMADSEYSMLLSQSLLEHGSFRLDYYALPRLKPMDRGYYISNGVNYRLELVKEHIYYHLPPGSSVLSVPYLAAAKLVGLKATNLDGTYNPAGELKIEAGLAALLMAALTVIFFYTATLILPTGWSVVVACGAAFGSQIWSTTSRAMWSDTWGIVLVGLAAKLLVADAVGKKRLNPFTLASLLAWSYFVRPTNSISIVAVSAYLLIYRRQLFNAYALIGAGWLVGFFAYSWYNFGHLLPSYYHSSRLTFTFFWEALAGNLISPSRGLLVYVPTICFVGYLLLRYWREVRTRPLALMALGTSAAHLVVVSAFPHWWGGYSFGPRFMTGLLPWLVLLAILGVDAMLRAARETAQLPDVFQWRMQLTIGALLLALSIFINARGAISLQTWKWNSLPVSVDDTPARLWDWREPQFLAGLITQTLPRKYPRLSGRVDFSASGADKYLSFGWSENAGPYRWTVGHEANVTFGLGKVSPLFLMLKMNPFLGEGLIDEQRVNLKLNGRLLASLSLKQNEPNEYKFVLPVEALRKHNLLTFELPDAYPPAALGLGTDPRRLGLAVYSLELQSPVVAP